MKLTEADIKSIVASGEGYNAEPKACGKRYFF